MAAPIYDDKAKSWTYPDKWTAEQRERWESLQGELAAEQRRAEAAAAGIEADTTSPEALELQLRGQVDEARAKREAAERQRAGEKAWLVAREQHADRATRLDTDEGDVFILLAMTAAEVDACEQRAERLSKARIHEAVRTANGAPPIEAMAAAEAKGGAEATAARQDAIIAKLAHPAAERAKAFLARKPLFWQQLYLARDRMILGERRAEGKGSAP